MHRRDFLAGSALLLAAGAARAQASDALTQGQFDGWLADIRPLAIKAGVNPSTWDAGLQGLTPTRW